MDDLQVIRDALAAATPGPWSVGIYSDTMCPVRTGRSNIADTGYTGSVANDKANAAYIAACSPDRIARLLKRLEDAERERDPSPPPIRHPS